MNAPSGTMLRSCQMMGRKFSNQTSKTDEREVSAITMDTTSEPRIKSDTASAPSEIRLRGVSMIVTLSPWSA